MKRENLVAYVMEHAESSEDIGWVAGQLIGRTVVSGFKEAVDKAMEKKND